MRWLRSAPLRWAVLGVAVLALLVVVLPSGKKAATKSPAFTLSLDPGTKLTGQAPDFKLTDQFGAPVSLSSFRGKVVILAFNDSECTTVCPLTTTAMVGARRLLGAAGSKVQLLGIDANPTATSVKDVRAYSEVHGMTHDWHFLTGSRAQLRRVWRAYHIEVAIERGQVDHTPALFVINPAGGLAKLYLTQMSYSSVDQQAQLLAQEASSLLPGHPAVASKIPYVQVPAIAPTDSVALPRSGGGTVSLGPGAPRLLLFFASWDRQVTDLGAQLEALERYQHTAQTAGLPTLTAVDEGSVEPSADALPRFLAALSRPLSFPVAIDRSGRVADGYGVQDEPWLVLVSHSGQPLWYDDVSTNGWPSTAALVSRVRGAMTQTPGGAGAAAAQALLAGSPPALAGLHRQAAQLLGSQSALEARLRTLRGFPVVVNAWASWCTPCREEFALFASASARYGRQIAFLGVDTDDSPSAAKAFLAQHPVSYPSYQSGSTDLRSLAQVEGLPTTIYLDRAGKVVYVHTGQYDSQGTLDQDITGYAR